MKIPYLLVRNPLLTGRPKGRITHRYVYRNGKMVEIFRDGETLDEKKAKEARKSS